MGGSSGGSGTTSSSQQVSPEVQELQRLALPQIRDMLLANPLSPYAAQQPRQIAGTNPFYEAAFGLTPSLSRPTSSHNILYGSGTPSIFPGQGAPQPLSSGLPQTPQLAPMPQLSQPPAQADLQTLIQQQVQQILATQGVTPTAGQPPQVAGQPQGQGGGVPPPSYMTPSGVPVNTPQLPQPDPSHVFPTW